MNGLMMDYDLTLPAILRRTEKLYAEQEIVTRQPDRSLHRYTYADFIERAKKLAVALKSLGAEEGDRVATLCWNNYQHLECYFGIPCAGAVLHTLNLRLLPEDLAYIVEHAGDKVLISDESLLPLLQSFRDEVDLERVIVVGEAPEGMTSYEDLLASANPAEFEWPELDEKLAAAMCYTSGTTGRPKGVLYTHRSLALHSLATLAADTVALSESDAVLPVVPMFHANAWGVPFSAALTGSKQVLPGLHLDPNSLLELAEAERVTLAAGVPTIWLGVLQELDRDPAAYDLTALRATLVGGSAVPEAMIRGFYERHGILVQQGWGMTETAPLATVAHLKGGLRHASEDEQYRHRARQGYVTPFTEVRIISEDGEAPWDGETMGELEIRGAWIASAYYSPPGGKPEGEDKFSEDGWLRTGDIATIDPQGYVEIRDRTKDLIKSGGEWISSVALENELMAHPSVAEAAVIAVSHPRWQERPLAVAVLKEGESATAEELISHLSNAFPKWSLPDAVEFVSGIPRTSTGKFKKLALREQFAGYALPGAETTQTS